MKLEAKEILDLGITLAHSDIPAAQRAGVSRIYQANLLHAIRRLTAGWAFVPPRQDNERHERVVAYIRELAGQAEGYGRDRALASMLDQLREARNHADLHQIVDDTTDCPYCLGAKLAGSVACEFVPERIKSLERVATELYQRLDAL